MIFHGSVTGPSSYPWFKNGNTYLAQLFWNHIPSFSDYNPWATESGMLFHGSVTHSERIFQGYIDSGRVINLLVTNLLSTVSQRLFTEFSYFNNVSTDSGKLDHGSVSIILVLLILGDAIPRVSLIFHGPADCGRLLRGSVTVILGSTGALEFGLEKNAERIHFRIHFWFATD